MSDIQVKRNTYRAVVMGNTITRSKTKGTPSINIKLRCEFDILQPNIPVAYTMYGNLWLTFKTIKNTLKTLKDVFGWKDKFIEDLNEPILVGKKCDIVVDEGEYEGKPTFDIQFYNKPGGLKSMESTDLQKLINEVQPMINEEMGNAPGAGLEQSTVKESEPELPAATSIDEAGEEITVVEDDLLF